MLTDNTPAALTTPATIALTRGMCLLSTTDRYDATGSVYRVRSIGPKQATVQTMSILGATWTTYGLNKPADFADTNRWSAVTEEAALAYVAAREALFTSHGCPRSTAFDNGPFMAYHRAHLALIAEVVAAAKRSDRLARGRKMASTAAA